MIIIARLLRIIINHYTRLPKKTPIFSCEKCDFICYKQNEYNRHIITNKHKRLHDTTEKKPINEPKTFNCKCGKIYRHHTSLAKHKHCCKGLNVSDNIKLIPKTWDFISYNFTTTVLGDATGLGFM